MIDQGWRYRWIAPESGQPESGWSERLGVDGLVATLLYRRGIRDTDLAREFLEPSLHALHDPRLLAGCARAAERLAEAVRDGEKIVIYGDYDVDGVTATAILHHVLRAADPRADVTPYVPHRLEEGYGLSESAIEKLCDQGARVIVSVDCGITACGPANAALERGVDLIITDHHQMGPQLPRAHTLVHPLLENDTGEPYPWPGLCGAGVAYKIAWQLARCWCGSERVDDRFRALLLDLLPLAALATIADVVPLVDENRTITRFGLNRIKHTGLTGLNALIDQARLRETSIDSYHVGFVLGPRLNAVGRLGHAKEAVRLLTDADADEATRIAKGLEEVNDARRARTREIFEQASDMVRAEGYDSDDVRAIVLAREQWHPGVIGIVCSRLVERFGRPAILLNLDGDVAQGSARSIDGFDIHSALTECGEHLDRFGGHAMAAGMRLAADRVTAFRAAMVACASRRLSVEDLAPALHLDAEVSLTRLSLDAVEQTRRLAPFGRENPKPLLRVNDLTLRQPARAMGADGRHMNLVAEHDGSSMRCVGWNMGEIVPRLAAGTKLDVVGEPSINEWRGRRNVELVLRDLRWT